MGSFPLEDLSGCDMAERRKVERGGGGGTATSQRRSRLDGLAIRALIKDPIEEGLPDTQQATITESF